ncbi:MAG: TonB-dependent receptor [Bryobacteraceae bacterium]|nr:TonB-dependent receptor [Bryobacteraceae bacterium]
MSRFLLTLVLAALTPLAGLSQTVSGTLAGTVTDSTGSVIPGVKVSAKNEQTGAVREATTNAEGYYLFSFTPLGSYQVTAAMGGFQTVEKTGVVVDLNKTTLSDFSLKPSAVTETVTISGEVPVVETTQGDVKHSLIAKQIDDTPLAGRNFLSLVEQVPGFQNAPWIGSSNNPTNSTGSYASFGGTGSRSTTFQIDGVNNDDSSENQNRQNVNVSAIREFQVLTNSYTAEFGRAGGAVVLVQTKSGTNRFHGDAYDYIQNDVFNANGFFQNQRNTPRQIVRRQQYGWTIGGPIFKDKVFFFHSGERIRNNTSSSISRFIWLPGDGPRACNAGEVSRPGGPYCVDPATHPNLQRDLAFMQGVMDLWKTPELSGVTPNDPAGCVDLIASGRPNRCVRVDGVPNVFPDSDYSGKIDWNAPASTTIALRYQYSRQIRRSGRIIYGDNFGIVNNRQYNIGLTATHIFSPRQTGEFRFGFGNRATLQDVVDGNHIPTIRFANHLTPSGTVIGTSTNVPINRRQHDRQFVYNHTIVLDRHTIKAGTDTRLALLDDLSGDRSRGFWTFSSIDSIASIRAGTGYTGWENFLRGFVTGFQNGYGNPQAENRFNEVNLYFQDDYRLLRNLTLNFGFRWEGVGAPREKEDRFSYGFGRDYDNIQPRFGFAYQPVVERPWLKWLTGDPGRFVIRGGYGIFHSRLFQSIFSQNQLSLRTQPPNGFASDFSALCRNEISDPSCGFVFTPGVASRTTAFTANGVRVPGGQLITTLLIPDPKLQVPYVQQWNLSVSRQLPKNMAIELTYNGNRTIGNLFYDSLNDARFPIESPYVSVDVGGGVFKPVVFDRVCRDNSDPICVLRDAAGNILPQSGTLRQFTALSSATASLADKGIVIVDGVPHGYVSLGEARVNERRPDPTFRRNVGLRNFGWGYYHGGILKFTKRTNRGLSLTGSWTYSKAIDTGSEATFTGVDTNAPAGKGNAARSLRGLSSFDARHRVVIAYGYDLPFYRTQRGVIGRVLGGWQITGVTTFQSGNPFTVALGYDANLDGLGGDRPLIADPSYLGRSVDDGRALATCPTATPAGVACPDTRSQLQLPGTIFIPQAAATIAAEQRRISPGSDGTGSIGRNTFLMHGMNNFDTTFQKSVTLTEGIRLNFRMEFYNLFNRVMFGVPARTILSGIPMGRIDTQRNPAGYVNSAREGGSRQGQFAIRLIF